MIKAYYRCLVGNGKLNRLLDASDLGIVGAYHPETAIITWKQGEIVTEERAKALCEVIKKAFNETEEFSCFSVELDRIGTCL